MPHPQELIDASRNSYETKLEKRIRELELLIADAHIPEMRPEFHARCFKRMEELELANSKLSHLIGQLQEQYDALSQENTKLRAQLDEVKSTLAVHLARTQSEIIGASWGDHRLQALIDAGR